MTREIALLKLLMAPGSGARTISRLLQRLRRENLPVEELLSTASPEELTGRYNLPETAVAALHKDFSDAYSLLDKLREHGIQLIDIQSDLYPDRLLDRLRQTAPPVLFVRGNSELLHKPTVAFAGARECSLPAYESTSEAASHLANQGATIVSGYASGIDSAAHTGALSSGGATVAVLASGMFHFSPRSDLATWCDDHNTLFLSEFFPTFPWKAHNAMTRNRTIAALSQALIIVEAGSTGGSLAAGRSALEIGCPLFVVDWPDPAPSTAGNALLLGRGAQPIAVDTAGRLSVPDIKQITALDYRSQSQSSLFE